VIRKDEEQSPQQTPKQFADNEQQQADSNTYVVDIEDVAVDQQNMTPVHEDSSIEPSLMSNHSAYIEVSLSDDESQQLTADKGFYNFLAFLYTGAQ